MTANEKHLLSDKFTMTIRDAAIYFSIGENKLRQIIRDNPDAKLSINAGNRVLVKRVTFEKFLEDSESV